MNLPDFSNAQRFDEPFPSWRADDVLAPDLAEAALDWLEDAAPWRLRETDFYEQYEFSLLKTDLPPALQEIVSDAFVASVADALRIGLSADPLRLTEVTAHRLIPGQTIRLHNDFLESGEETHRLLLQLNRGWLAENGGYLMLFGDDRPESLVDLLLPVHRSAFGFEISPKSYHAVSTIKAGERFTLVYTFCKAS